LALTLLTILVTGCGGGEPPPACNYVFTVGEPLCEWLASDNALACGRYSFTLPTGCVTSSCSCPIPSQTCNSQIPTAVPAECLNVAQVFQCTAGGISPITGLCQIFNCECFGLPSA